VGIHSRFCPLLMFHLGNGSGPRKLLQNMQQSASRRGLRITVWAKRRATVSLASIIYQIISGKWVPSYH